MTSSRLPQDTFDHRAWPTATLLTGFEVEDVWQLPIHGGEGDLAEVAHALAVGGRPDDAPRDSQAGDSRIYDALFAIRWWLGRRLGWDEATPRPGLRDELPSRFQGTRRGPDFTTVPLRSVVLTDSEWVVEIVNGTGHGVMHVGWVRNTTSDPAAGRPEFSAEMTVLFRPHGFLGRAYMTAIKPLRLWLVYPPLLKRFGADWEARERSADL